MAAHPLQDFLRRLRRARSVTEGGHLTDAQLLERFAQQRDEAAFEVLVWRHGPLVLNTARRLLHQDADAEDVFQATFLTLARKASAIRRGTSVGSWLYKVAYRLALRMRQKAAQRERREQPGVESAIAAPERDDGDMAAVLAEEVSRLPERCRDVVVLCYLQGATTEEAARVLGCPRGTVLSRLASARQRLQQRLQRRGIAPAVALAAVSFGAAASAGPAVALVACVVGAALPFAAGRAAIPMVSTQVAALAQGALQTMLWNKIKIVAAMVCVIGLAGTGASWLARGRGEVEASPPLVVAPPVKKETAPAAAPKREDNTEKEIAEIRTRMDGMAAMEHEDETETSKEIIQHRLNLLFAQDELSRIQEVLSIRREEKRDKIKAMTKEITELEKKMAELAERAPGVEDPRLKSTDARIKARVRQIEELIATPEERIKDLLGTRRQMIQEEETLRCLEARRNRQREHFAAQRERLQTRLDQLENKKLDLEPADRIRDVERKLDALRREIGELRRTLERPKER